MLILLHNCFLFYSGYTYRCPFVGLLKDLTLSPPIPLRLYTFPYWSNPSFIIFDIRVLWRSGLSARMSKIINVGLDQYGAGPFEQQQFGTANVEGVNGPMEICPWVYSIQVLIQTPQNSWKESFPSPSLSPACRLLSTICWSSESLRLEPTISLRVWNNSPFDMNPSLSMSYTLNATIYHTTHAARCRVLEYVFYVFFRFQKTWLFTFYWNGISKSRKKSLAKV